MLKISENSYEKILYGVILSIVLLTTVAFIPGREDFRWNKLVMELLKIGIFFVVFLVNIFLLFPKFFLKRKYTTYLIIAVLVSIFSGISSEFLFDLLKNKSPRGMQHMPQGNGFSRSMPYFFHLKMWSDITILSFLIIGFSTFIKIMFRNIAQEKLQKEIEREQLSTELKYLKHQISPHFLMNTLNNIHALVDIDAEQAKDAVITLSKMMRYLLYESSTEKISLQKEIVFLKNYIELMQKRYEGMPVEIIFDVPKNVPNIEISPLLFIPFLENAFKHGISYQQTSFIRSYIKLTNVNIIYHVENTKAPINNTNKHSDASGIGFENVKKRLDLLYKDKYSLDIKSDELLFFVHITLPIL